MVMPMVEVECFQYLDPSYPEQTLKIWEYDNGMKKVQITGKSGYETYPHGDVHKLKNSKPLTMIITFEEPMRKQMRKLVFRRSPDNIWTSTYDGREIKMNTKFKIMEQQAVDDGMWLHIKGMTSKKYNQWMTTQIEFDFEVRDEGSHINQIKKVFAGKLAGLGIPSHTMMFNVQTTSGMRLMQGEFIAELGHVIKCLDTLQVNWNEGEGEASAETVIALPDAKWQRTKQIIASDDKMTVEDQGDAKEVKLMNDLYNIFKTHYFKAPEGDGETNIDCEMKLEGDGETKLEGDGETQIDGETKIDVDGDTKIEGDGATKIDGDTETKIDGDGARDAETKIDGDGAMDAETKIEVEDETKIDGDCERKIEGDAETKIDGDGARDAETKIEVEDERKIGEMDGEDEWMQV